MILSPHKRRIPKGKRGYLWVDWVTLGTLGWELEPQGAEGSHLGCCEYDLAHLDRVTLDIMLGGCRRFVARVMNDLREAGLFYYQVPTPYVAVPAVHRVLGIPQTVDSAGTTAANVDFHCEFNAGTWKVADQIWSHPSGGTIRLTTTPKPPSRLRSWWDTLLMAHATRWLALFDRYTKLRKVA